MSAAQDCQLSLLAPWQREGTSCCSPHWHLVGREASLHVPQRRETEPCQGKPCGAGLCVSRLCRALLWPCPDFSLTSSSSYRKMRSSEKYLRRYVQRKYWKGSGLKFKCSLEGIPSFSAHSWYRYFLLEMSCAFH